MAFTIAADNNITLHATLDEAQALPDTEVFSSSRELVKLASGWPASTCG